MSTAYSDLPVVKYEGPQSTNPLAYRWYDAKRVVLGKTLAEHLRPAVCYWHNFCWKGEDVFGLGNTVFQREWFNEADPVKAAHLKLDAAFDFFGKLGLPYWCFHDRDVAPKAPTSPSPTASSTACSKPPPRRCRTARCSCCGARPTCSPTVAS